MKNEYPVPLFPCKSKTEPVKKNLLFVKNEHSVMFPRISQELQFVLPGQCLVSQSPVNACKIEDNCMFERFTRHFNQHQKKNFVPFKYARNRNLL